MEKNILVSEFVKKYNSLKSEEAKAAQVKAIMKRTYCPILEKKLVLERMVELSKGDGNITYLDMVLSKLNFTMAIIALYTNLIVDKNEDGTPKSAESYDLLVQADLVNSICNEIGEREINELMSINAYSIETWHNKNTGVESYILNLVEKMAEKFGVVAGAGAQQLASVLDDEEKMKKTLNVIQKAIKKVK